MKERKKERKRKKEKRKTFPLYWAIVSLPSVGTCTFKRDFDRLWMSETECGGHCLEF